MPRKIPFKAILLAMFCFVAFKFISSYFGPALSLKTSTYGIRPFKTAAGPTIRLGAFGQMATLQLQSIGVPKTLCESLIVLFTVTQFPSTPQTQPSFFFLQSPSFPQVSYNKRF